MQSDYLPLLERNFFRQESRLARWGAAVIFASGVALFLALFAAMLAVSIIVGHAAAFIKLLLG